MVKKNLLLLFLIFYSLISFATHIRGGQITIERVSDLTYKIKLAGYTRLSSVVKMGGGTLDFGDGTTVITPHESDPPEIAFNVGLYSYVVMHTYHGPGFYNISYYEQNLDEGILNVSNSVATPFYLESGFLIDPFLPNHSFAKFAAPPIFSFVTGDRFSFASAPVEAANSIYSYQLTSPQYADYTFPDSVNINPQSGLMTWGTKFKGTYQAGEYLFAVRITQFDQDKNFLGYVTRVFTLVLEDAPFNVVASSQVNDPIGKITVLNGNQKTIKVILSDDGAPDSLTWLAYYDSSKLSGNITFNQYDSSHANVKFKVGKLHLSTTSSIMNDLPYEIILRGYSSHGNVYGIDESFFFFTKDVDLPVVTAVKLSDQQQTIYPNPFSNELYFSRGDEKRKVEIYNENGYRVQTAELDCDGKIDTSQLLPGLYIFKVSDGVRISRIKAIKK